MRVATKLNVGILLVFVATVLGNYAALEMTVRPKFDETEEAAAHADHKRVLEVIDSMAEKLRASSQDNAFWDDAYAYASGVADESWITSTFGSPADGLDALGIELLAFKNANDALLWGKAFELGAKQELPEFLNELASLKYVHPYLSNSGALKASSGLVSTSRGLMMLAVAPIVRNDRTGPPMGTVWMAAPLKVENVEQLAGVGVGLDLVSDAAQIERLKVHKTANLVETTSLISDIVGRPLGFVTTKSPRQLSLVGSAAIHSAAFLMMLTAAIVILTMRAFVNKLVVSPIQALKDHLAATDSSGKLSPVSHALSSDEIGDLGRAFNAMALRVSSLRDALLISAHHSNNAYAAGMAEWAAGTLHNVRNGLSPINLHSWKIKQLFSDERLAKLKAAIQQLENPDTPHERREKLKLFVVANAALLIDNGVKTSDMIDQIISASKGIQDIASEYEAFSRQETKLEEIDVAALVAEVAKISFVSHDAHVAVELPASTTLVVGNVTILRQVLSNLFLNAVEAMSSNEHDRRIRIDLRHVTSGVELTVTDNGDGIAPEYLSSVFQRGFSTRTQKRGGLGLHWCSRALKSFGGTLRVESEGRGKGATLIVFLPTTDLVRSEAA